MRGRGGAPAGTPDREIRVADYNGWTNYETWLINLHLSNEQGSYLHWTERAAEVLADGVETATGTREQNASYALAAEMKGEFEENVPEVLPVWSDLINAALSEVNWFEIAEHWITDAKE